MSRAFVFEIPLSSMSRARLMRTKPSGRTPNPSRSALRSRCWMWSPVNSGIWSVIAASLVLGSSGDHGGLLLGLPLALLLEPPFARHLRDGLLVPTGHALPSVGDDARSL